MTGLSEFGSYEVDFFDEGEWIFEVWSRDGVYHRVGKPAIIYYDPETRAEIKRIYKDNGLTHRNDGPALEEIDLVSGVVTLTEFYDRHQLHRVGKPARIIRNPKTGDVVSVEFFENGQKIDYPSEPSQGR